MLTVKVKSHPKTNFKEQNNTPSSGKFATVAGFIAVYSSKKYQKSDAKYIKN